MEVKVSKEKIKEIYNVCIGLRDMHEVKGFINKQSEELGATYNSISSRLCYYCRKNNLLPVRNVIYRNNAKKINQIVSKNPNNLADCFREYVNTYYPELCTKKDKKAYERKLYAISHFWYKTASKKSVCFMTASTKGHVAINRKNTTTVNKTKKRSFLSKLRTNVRTFFENMRES